MTARRTTGFLGAGPWQMAVLAACGSAILLAAAYSFQFFGGYAPCPLCLWQRWPHWIAAALGVAVLAAPVRVVAPIGTLAMVVGAGIGIYHAGVEYGWWLGPATCAAPNVAGLSADELFDRIMAAPVVRCDEVVWSLLGLSMAGWNALASLFLAAVWGTAYASSSASQ